MIPLLQGVLHVVCSNALLLWSGQGPCQQTGSKKSHRTPIHHHSYQSSGKTSYLFSLEMYYCFDVDPLSMKYNLPPLLQINDFQINVMRTSIYITVTVMKMGIYLQNQPLTKTYIYIFYTNGIFCSQIYLSLNYLSRRKGPLSNNKSKGKWNNTYLLIFHAQSIY